MDEFFCLDSMPGLARMRSLILGVGSLNKAAAALCAAWFFCAHPSLKQASLGMRTKKPLNFRWAAAVLVGLTAVSSNQIMLELMPILNYFNRILIQKIQDSELRLLFAYPICSQIKADYKTRKALELCYMIIRFHNMTYGEIVLGFLGQILNITLT